MKNFNVVLIAGLLLPLAGCVTSQSLPRRWREPQNAVPSHLTPHQSHTSSERTSEERPEVAEPGVSRVNVITKRTTLPEGVSSVETVKHQTVEIPPTPAEKTQRDEGRQTDSEGETFPIDLVTVIRLVNINSPAIGYSRARVDEAAARADAAELQWLPKLSVGATYSHFDGQTQNQRGEIFSVSRGNLFGNGGVSLSLDLADAVYRPLIERQLANAEQQRAQATSLFAEIDAISAFLDLAHVHGLLEINASTLEKGEAMLNAAQHAQKAKLDRSPGDVNRVRTEILLRRQERIELLGRSGGVSARLGRLLLLKPTVKLVPDNSGLIPITLVPRESSLDDLVSTAIQNRPDLNANRELLAVAWSRVRMAQQGPFLPKLQIADQAGSFGGGLNANLQNFEGRNALIGGIYWELKNLGFGNHLETVERQAGVEQAHFQLLETQARLSAEVVEATQTAAARYQMLAVAEEMVKEASELYRVNEEGTFNVVDAKNLFDALRPLQAMQLLHQARQSYLNSVIEYNRAQYRLYTALGCPQSIGDMAKNTGINATSRRDLSGNQGFPSDVGNRPRDDR